MKLKILLIGCISSILLFSCIAEGLPECPPSVTLQLTFSYLGDTNDPYMFGRKIDHVTLFVYDENEKQVLTQTLNKNELTRQQGTDLFLDPGNYKIVCWGNAHEFTRIYRHELFTESRIHHPNFFDHSSITTNSHLYYGAYSATVPENGMASGDVSFCGAHINVEVYIRDLTSKNANNSLPQVEAHNLMPQYDMEMKPVQPYSTTYYPETNFNAERGVSQTLFQVLRFNDDNPVRIEVKEPDGKSKCRIELKKYMADNKITVNGKNEATVSILIEDTDLGVAIKLPEWVINEVTPGTK
ncbi:FimB/Mfa2 family fimbrial subunit [Bacteroides sp. 224]|uniref:FimB/Mfa2 family fimbrial subunit n=1 Tax=Bacteroides sp. 224 TaxID=2302936 RepID=UPI0013D838BD|nr:FimB/Mfa2 family fimbrial subunit [Bacteroides sp. 224]